MEAARSISQNILFIDIETVSGMESYQLLPERFQKLWDRKAQSLPKKDTEQTPADQYFERAAIYSEFGKIICIGIGFTFWQNNSLRLKVKCIAGHNEAEILQEFTDLISSKFNKKNLILCAHNGKEFDFPYLGRRMLVNNIKVPKVLQMAGKKPWEVPHLDTLELWKFGDKKNFTSLDLLAALFDIESSKVALSGDRVNATYYLEKDLPKIAEYCLEDVVVLAQLFLKINGLNTIPAQNIERISEHHDPESN
jgi:3'-5' exonuclease